MRRVFKISLLVFLLILGAGWFLLQTPDIDRDLLIERYGGPPSFFLRHANGVDVHIRDTQDQNQSLPVLLLLHGSNASLHTWEELVDRLKGDMRLIRIDLPGHGLTGPVVGEPYGYDDMANFALSVMDALDVQRFSVAGNSMGGGVALAMAAHPPERIERLLLIDSVGAELGDRVREKTDRPLVFQYASNPIFSFIAQRITPRSLVHEGLMKSFTDPDFVNEDMVNRYWELARYPGSRAATMQRFALYSERGKPKFEFDQIKHPVMVIWGEEDGLIPVASAEFFQERLDVTQVLLLPNVGHLPQEEAVDEVAAAILRFMTLKQDLS